MAFLPPCPHPQRRLLALLLFVLLHLLLFPSVTSSPSQTRVFSSAFTKCPCVFLISVPHSSPHTAADLRLQLISNTAKPQLLSAPQPHSRDIRNVYYRVALPVSQTLSLQVVTSAHILATIHNASTRSSRICPVLIPTHPTARIIGGQNANPALVSYMAFLVTPISEELTYLCTGFIISPRHILTAAHCSLSLSTKVFLNTSRFVSGFVGDTREVESVTVHPLFDPDASTESIPFDIAYLTLSKRIPASARMMRLTRNVSLPIPESAVRNIGYGITDRIDKTANARYELNQVDSTAPSANFCEQAYESVNGRFNSSLLICAGGEGCGICDGDSGGPLIQYDEDDNPVALGIVSSSVGCAIGAFPATHVRIAAYAKFLPKKGVTFVKTTKAVLSPPMPRLPWPSSTAVPSRIPILEESPSPLPSVSSSISSSISSSAVPSAGQKPPDADGSASVPSPSQAAVQNRSESASAGLSQTAVIVIVASASVVFLVLSVAIVWAAFFRSTA